MEETSTANPVPWPLTVDWKLDFSKPPLQKARSYWQALCRDRRMPRRRELDPRAMKEFIRYVNLVDIVRSGTNAYEYIVSLQSNHARDVLGNIENRPLHEILPPAVAQRWRSAFDLPCLHAAPVRLTTRTSTIDRQWLDCEILLAPLGSGDADAIFWAAMASPAAPASAV